MKNTVNHYVDQIIDSSLDNTAGTTVNKLYIEQIVSILIARNTINRDIIDALIDENSNETGYLVKASDFIYVLKEIDNENGI